MNLLDKELIPISLPHYDTVDDKLLFMNFRKKECSTEELKTLKCINGVDSCENLISNGTSIEVLKELIRKKYIILVPKESRYVCKSSVLILAPHVDDTAFAMGGFVAKNLGKLNIYVINVFGRQDHTMYWEYYNSSRVKNYPIEEEEVFKRAALIKKDYIWNFEDAPLRKGYQNGKVYVASDSTAEEIVDYEKELFNSICIKLKDAINKLEPDFIYCPLAVGRHVDHILLREALLNIYYDTNCVIFYEDMPYSISFKKENNIREIEMCLGNKLSRTSYDISAHIDTKKEYISIYQSQLKKFQVNSIIDYSIDKNNLDGKAYEYFWHCGESFF